MAVCNFMSRLIKEFVANLQVKRYSRGLQLTLMQSEVAKKVLFKSLVYVAYDCRRNMRCLMASAMFFFKSPFVLAI